MFKALGLTFSTVGRRKKGKETKNLAAHWCHTSVLSKARAEKTLWPKGHQDSGDLVAPVLHVGASAMMGKRNWLP